MSAQQTVAVGLILGLVAGLVVWWLERFETERLHREVGEYLGRYSEFEDWLRERKPPPR